MDTIHLVSIFSLIHWMSFVPELEHQPNIHKIKNLKKETNVNLNPNLILVISFLKSFFSETVCKAQAFCKGA